MKQVHTAVLERFGTFSGAFATEPYEAGWAEEAIFFVKVDAVDGGEATLTGQVQISPDGITWIDEGTPLPAVKKGVACARVRHFGNWLRVACRVSGGQGTVQGTIYLCLKG